TAHHHEAIEIAKDARNHGENSEALELAAQIIANQETQIKHMEELLNTGLEGGTGASSWP
ncbi:MAG TPA: DUF305 domain-containing protein, partial [Beutenbergiaceae bacterium]|nr:DUF305 domain-containing protein [Beutenbergiaceae bacterium]